MYEMTIQNELETYQKLDRLYNDAADKIGSSMGIYGLSSMLFALLFTLITRKISINRRMVHMISLILGGIGFLYMYYASDYKDLNVSFALIGIAWGSILSLPYAMLSSSIEAEKMGIFMGLFNMFIVIPQIVASLGGINFFTDLFFGSKAIGPMLLAGSCLIISGLCNLIITNKKAIMD